MGGQSLWVALLVALAVAPPPPRVLGPEVAPVVLRALRPVVAPWRIDALTADASSVRVRLCLETDCHELVLGDPEPTCEAGAAGPFCPSWPEVVGAPARAAMATALAGAFGNSPWHTPEGEAERPGPETLEAEGVAGAEGAPSQSAPGPPDPSEAPASAGSTLLLWLLALTIAVLPALAGAGLGHLLRRRREAPLFAPLAWLPGPLLTLSLLLLVSRQPTWPLHDLSWAALTGGAGFALAARARSRQLDWRGPVAGVLGLLLALGLAEVGTRLLAPPLAQAPPPQRARLTFDHAELEWGCAALFPERFPDVFYDLRPGPRGSPRVLHLGDSMVAATGVAPSERFLARLETRLEGSRHLNLGVVGTGSDHHLALLRAYLTRAEPDAVVYHLFAGNDVLEIDRAYTCCGGGPLLDGALATRCAEPRWRYPWQLMLARHPAPWFVRVMASGSRFALLALRGFELAVAPLDPNLGLDTEGTFGEAGSWQRLDTILAAMGRLADAQGVPLIVSVLPYRGALLDPDHPAEAARLKMLERARAAGLVTLDPTPMLREAAEAEGQAALFSDSAPWDVHFSARGHQVYGDWLAERLPGLLQTPGAGVH